MSIKIRITPNSLSTFRQGTLLATTKVAQAANEGLEIAARHAFDSAQARAPKVTGALVTSGKLTNRNSGELLRRIISYGDASKNPRTGRATSRYATRVHEVYSSKHPDSYKWLEKALLEYGKENFLREVASVMRTSI